MTPKAAAVADSAFSVDRLASLSDGVFAVAMTLLAYNVRVLHGPLSEEQLRAQLGGLTHDIEVLFLSFAVAAMFWRGHIKLLEVMRQGSQAHITAALVFLLFVVLLPISTGLDGAFSASKTIAPLYVGNLAALSLAQLGLWIVTVVSLPLNWRARLLYVAPSLVVSLVLVVAAALSCFRPEMATRVCIIAFASPFVSRFAWKRERIHAAIAGGSGARSEMLPDTTND